MANNTNLLLKPNSHPRSKEMETLVEGKKKERNSKPYLLTHFTLVKYSVQVTAICNLFSVHRSYDITQNKSAISITFGWLQTLQKRDSHMNESRT